ncbi:type II secretion system minor pseudopilin GspH [Serratia fonticola]|uniref:type II secretion system minor pseudopilin GspH n=1 Tax=Serratia fonticola TaxID=47917 RepID=UPI000BA2807A|nr:type II secretion system minor pseudopilin GspH [Serratia fonticola]PAA97790.1 type II secretion system protein GspH [Serratia fonticola]
MRQRGFTLLEMMLVVLLIGSAASLVIMSFPAMQQNNPQLQLKRFQAQLAFAMDAAVQNDQLLGIRVRPDGWQFQMLQRQAAEKRGAVSGSDSWQGYVWQNWQPRQAALGSQMPDDIRLKLHFPDRQEWPRAAESAPEPDILLLPGGEITPFELVFSEAGSQPLVWMRVDDVGAIESSVNGAAQ